MSGSRKTSRACAANSSGGCGAAGSESLLTLEQIIASYLKNDAPRSQEELAYFAHPSQSLDQAIGRAGRSALENGKIYPHQQRIGHQKCALIARELLPHAASLSGCSDFTTLYERVATALGSVFQRPGLTVYDIAHRIGHYLRIEPDRVYLHRGVREGARALIPNLPNRQRTLHVTELPAPLRKLTAAQCEDLLCIYKSDLKRVMHSGDR